MHQQQMFDKNPAINATDITETSLTHAQTNSIKIMPPVLPGIGIKSANKK